MLGSVKIEIDSVIIERMGKDWEYHTFFDGWDIVTTPTHTHTCTHTRTHTHAHTFFCSTLLLIIITRYFVQFNWECDWIFLCGVVLLFYVETWGGERE